MTSNGGANLLYYECLTDRHVEKENLADFIAKKREMFLVQVIFYAGICSNLILCLCLCSCLYMFYIIPWVPEVSSMLCLHM